jgi:hypothetical protein
MVKQVLPSSMWLPASPTAVLELDDTSEDFSPRGLVTTDPANSGMLPIKFNDCDNYTIPPTSSPSNSEASFGSDSESDEDDAESATSSKVNSINGNLPDAAHHGLTDSPSRVGL